MDNVTKALKQICPSLAENVFDYSSREDFSKLWQLDANSLPQDRIIIIWNDLPADPILWPIEASSHLDPLTWAVAFCTKTARQSATCPTIQIVDPSGRQYRPNATWRFFQLLSEKIQKIRLLTQPTLTDLLTQPALQGIIDSIEKESLQLIVDGMVTDMTGRNSSDTENNHHSISNIIGPMCLRNKPLYGSSHAAALNSLLGATGLITDLGKGKFNYESTENLTDLKNVKFYLLDDQAIHGWAGWVEDIIGSCPSFENNPSALVQAIKDSLGQRKQGGFNNKDARFRLKLPGHNHTDRPLLLLDLRLFSGQEKKERLFLKDELLPLIEHFTDKDDLAWPCFSSTDRRFAAAKKAVENNQLKIETDEHHEVLTWLPRVVALADLAMPIIIFSSTGRRDLTEPFKPYGNIITSFEKPRLSDFLVSINNTDVRNACSIAFCDAVDSGKRILKFREKCLTIKELAESQAELTNRIKPKRNIYVELYLDEVKNPQKASFAVGGVFAVYDNSQNADRFEDKCVESGLRYFKDNLFSPNAAALDKHKDSGLKQLEMALSNYSSDFIKLGSVKLRRGDSTNMALPLETDQEDSMFWRLTEAIIELFIAETLPELKRALSANLVKFAIYTGTRNAPISGVEGDFSYKSNREIHWYANDQDNGLDIYLRSMSGCEILPMVEKFMQIHGLDTKCYQIDRCLALALPYENEPKDHVDRVIYRPTKAIFSFDARSESYVFYPCNACDTCFGRVVNNKSNFLFARIKGLKDNLFCHMSDSKEQSFDQLEPDQPISLQISQDNHKQNSIKGINIRAASTEDLDTWESTRIEHALLSDAFLKEKSADNFRPDYRALHYVADQFLRSPGRFSGLIDNATPGQFYEDFTQAFAKVLETSRLLDAKEIDGALKRFPVESLSEVRNISAPKATPLVAFRLWRELQNCKGMTVLSAL